MKNLLKKSLVVFMVVVLTFTAAPLAGFDSLFAPKAQAKSILEYEVGDIIEFGWYPQSEVTDSDIIAKLNSAGGEWISYNYYSGTGTSDDGKMTAGDYMRYKDVVYGLNKYRGVVFDSYRPNNTGGITTLSGSFSYQYYNDYFCGNIYWFKYEPIEWRVLAPAVGLVIAETIIDAQPYNNYILQSGTDEYGYAAYWSDSPETYANNYAESSIRKWLNDDFYNVAFSFEQQDIIGYTQLDNSAYSSEYSDYDSATTNDKIYLLSYSDALNTSYGFSSKMDRYAEPTAYAMAQGVSVNYSSETSAWWLRTPAVLSSNVCIIDHSGIIGDYGDSVDDTEGIRPALRFDITSEIFQSDVRDAGVEYEVVRDTPFWYMPNGDTIEIFGCENSISGDIVIPSHIDGLPVVSIAMGAFCNKDNITSITIPDTVEYLGYNSFSSCDNLKYVYIGKNVNHISSESFLCDVSLAEIEVAEDNEYFTTIAGDLYNKEKTELIQYALGKSTKEFTVPETVKEIQWKAFTDAKNLTAISMSDNVNYLGHYAFAGCDNLVSVKLSKGIDTISGCTFRGCLSLTEIIIPDGVTNLEATEIFSGCESLRCIHIPSSVTVISSDLVPNNFTYICSDTENCYAKTYADENGIEFRVCTGHGTEKPPVEETTTEESTTVPTTTEPDTTEPTTEVPTTEPSTTIPTTVPVTTEPALTVPTTTKPVTTVPATTVPTTTKPTTEAPTTEPATTEKPTTGEDDNNYEPIDPNRTVIDSGDCGADVDNVKWVLYDDGELVISGNGKMADYYFDHPIFSIISGLNTDASSTPWLSYNDQIIRVTIKDSVTSIGDLAFFCFTQLRYVTFADSVTDIGICAFFNCDSLTELNIPDSVNNIGNSAFISCSNLASIKLPSGIETIEYGTFWSCSNLTDIEIPNGVTKIGQYAFRDCGSLINITLPSSMMIIEAGAFAYSDSIRNVYYMGTQSDWNKIDIDSSSLLGARIHCYGNSSDTGDGDDNTGDSGNSGNNDDSGNSGDNDNTPDTAITPEDSSGYKTIEGVFERSILVAFLDTDEWTSNIVVDGAVYTLKPDYAHELDLLNNEDNFKNKQVVAVLYNNRVVWLDTKENISAGNSSINAAPTCGFYYIESLVYKDGKLLSESGSKKITVSGYVKNQVESTFADITALPEMNLENVKVTITSGNENIIYFKSGLLGAKSNSVTFDLGSSVGLDELKAFEKTARVNTGYEFPENSKQSSVALTCNITGEVNGKKVSATYSTEISLTNGDYGSDLKENWESQTYQELLAQIQKEVNRCPDLTPGEKVEVTAILNAKSISETILQMDKEIETLEGAYDLACYAAGIKNPTIATAGKLMLEKITEESSDAEQKLKDELNKSFESLKKSVAFNKFAYWYYLNYQVQIGNLKEVTGKCPIDIRVKDEDGIEVLTIINDQVVLESEGTHAIVFNNRKTMYLPTDINHTIEITATGNGTMDYSVREYSSDSTQRKVEYNDVALTTGVSFVSNISMDLLPDPETYNLVSNNGQEINNDSVSYQDSENDYIPETLNVDIKIKQPSTATINYGETLVMHADFGGVELPEGWRVEWSVEGAGFNMAPEADGLTCKMTSVANGNATVKATLVDENGEAVLDTDGNEMSDSKNLTSKAGFFQKFISFFKNLFGISRIILQSI